MFELLKDFLLKVLGLVLPFVVRWFYKREKFIRGIKVRVRSEGDGITYDCGELPNVRIWLILTNLTPFEVEFERMFGPLAYGGVIGDFVHLKRYVLPPAQEKEIFLEIWLNEAQVQYMRRHQGNYETKLFLSSHITSKVHCIELTLEITSNHVRFLNCTL